MTIFKKMWRLAAYTEVAMFRNSKKFYKNSISIIFKLMSSAIRWGIKRILSIQHPLIFKIVPEETSTNLNERNYYLLLEKLQSRNMAFKNILEKAAEFELSHENIFRLCLEGVKNNGIFLKHVLESKNVFLTAEKYKIICLAAVKECGFALEYIDFTILYSPEFNDNSIPANWKIFSNAIREN